MPRVPSARLSGVACLPTNLKVKLWIRQAVSQELSIVMIVINLCIQAL